MNYIKYFLNDKFKLGQNDCWTFVQEVFKNENNIILPDVPVINNTNESFLKSNINHKAVKKAHSGCLIFIKTIGNNHVGYAINEKEFIHKTLTGVKVSQIPASAEIYEIIE